MESPQFSNLMKLFETEFHPMLNKFNLSDLTLDKALIEGDAIARPGVYVFWKVGLGVIKVGKSNVNSRARALQHIRDNTRNGQFEMQTLKGDKDCHLLLFNVGREEDVHWLLALEYFFEKNACPLIHSKRNG